MFRANSENVTRTGMPADVEVLEETLEPCNCADESVKLSELKDPMHSSIQGGIIGKCSMLATICTRMHRKQVWLTPNKIENDCLSGCLQNLNNPNNS